MRHKNLLARISRRHALLGAGAVATAAILPRRSFAQAAEPLRWVLSRNLQATPAQVGVVTGIYDRYGFDAKIKLVDGGSAMTKAVQVGEAELGFAAIGNLISARAAGVGVKGYGILCGDSAALNPDGIYGIVASSRSGISKPSDLAGKRVGTMMGSTLETYLRGVLAAAKVPADSVSFVNVLQHTARAALASIDAVTTASPFLEICLAQEKGSRLIVRGGGYVGQRAAIISADDWTKRKPDVAERAITAAMEAMQYTRQHQDEAAQITAQWIGSDLDLAVMREALKYFDYDPRITNTVEKSWKTEDEILVSGNKTKRSVPYSEGFDPSVAVAVITKHPELLSDLR
jgi:ABC-type nitrate/sulfonate/bicarbonate transport system substrate-binding protein